MMSYLPHSLLFSFTMVISTLLALSSNHWLMMWLSMELNLLAFLPLMMLTSQNQEIESMIKYFLAQATGSILFLLGALHLSPILLFLSPKFPIMILTLGLLFKLGAAPCHFWFPNVMASASWTICMILATWQKIIPLWVSLSSSLPVSSPILFMSGATSALVGGLGGLNQTQIRPLLAYSSINHTGWILASSPVSQSSSMLYFMVYSIILIPIIGFLKNFSFNYMKLQAPNSLPSKLMPYTIVLLLSLAGLPPFLGFIPKFIIIYLMMTKALITLCSLLILGSLISLLFYLNLSFNILINYKKFFSKPLMKSSNPWMKISILSLGPLFLAPTGLLFL